MFPRVAALIARFGKPFVEKDDLKDAPPDRAMRLRGAAQERAARMAAVARTWRAARDAFPDLALQLIDMGGILSMQPTDMTDGNARPAPLTSELLAYEAGRRDLALTLLAAMQITPFDLNQIMEIYDEPQ